MILIFMSETRQQVCIRLWKLIKQPFVLPCAFSHTHECKWKSIDAGLLGCELCGSIHACADLTCKNVIETDDGTVCALSGMYIRTGQFVLTEYQDTVNLTDMKLSHRIIEETAFEDIHNIFEKILLSKTAQDLLIKQQLNCVLKIHQHFKRNTQNNVMWCCQAMQTIRNDIWFYDEAVRRNVLRVASRNCFNVLSILVSDFGMYIKSSELQEMAVGLLFLMRIGINTQGKTILPAIPELAQMLPAEGVLKTHFNIRSKYITESENRTKQCLRHANTAKLHNTQFNFIT